MMRAIAFVARTAAWISVGAVILWAAVGLGDLTLAAVLTVIAGLLWAYRRVSPSADARWLRLQPADLDELSGAEFESWVIAKLTSDGVTASATAATRDFGVDIVAEHQGRRVGIQAKKRKGKNVGNAAVQEVNAGCDYYDCEVAAVVTQARFTSAARAQAERLNRPCVLIGRDELDLLSTLIKEAPEASAKPT